MIYSIKTYDCGCKIQKRLGANPNCTRCWIDYCPTHKAAPELVEALELAYANLGAVATSKNTFNHVALQLKQALAKVEGKEGGR